MNQTLNYQQAISFVAGRLKNSGHISSGSDARILLSHVLSRPLEYILSNPEVQLTNNQGRKLQELLDRRLKLEPIAYITEKKEFYGRLFAVNSSVLIPRPETELLVEVTLELIRTRSNPALLELGTGSGCISITLALEVETCKIIATDISENALRVASKNADLLSTKDRITFIQSDWFGRLASASKFDVIVSNPPYISTNDINLVAKETLLHEPYSALFAAQQGLSSYRLIALEAKNFLKSGGLVVLEIGFNQKEEISQIFRECGFTEVNSYRDLAGHDRVVVFG